MTIQAALTAHYWRVGRKLRIKRPEPAIVPVVSAEDEPEPTAAPVPVLTRPPTVAAILAAVAEAYGLSPRDIASERRTYAVVRPRQLVMYLASTYTPRSFAHIGRLLGGKDHTTALYGARQIRHRLGDRVPTVTDTTTLAELVQMHKEALT
jgi:hypothetical protein